MIAKLYLLPRSRRAALLASLLLVAACGGKTDRETAGSEEVQGPSPGTLRMAERLDQLRRESDPIRSVLSGEAEPRLAFVRGRRDEARGSGRRDAEVELTLVLADELLAAGRTAEASRELEDMLAAAPAWQPPLDAPSLTRLRRRLAVSYLRRGEEDNCLARHGPDSCLLPLRGSGIHSAQEGSRAAVAALTRVLEDEPGGAGDLWLLNLAYMTLGEYPDGVPESLRLPPEVFASEQEFPRFENAAGRLGLDRRSLSGGAVLEDFDGDGLLDVMVSAWGMVDQLRYFHSVGDGRFEDWTERAGLTGLFGGLNLIHADYDNDGDADVLVLRGAWARQEGLHPNSLLRNEGGRRFSDVTEESGLLSFHPTQTADWADYDLDGDLDLFIGNETTGPEQHPCELYRNQGNGRFLEVARDVGLGVVGFVKGVAWGDYDNDGLPDLYLSRLGEPNLLFRNDGGTAAGWHFSDVTAVAGVAEPLSSFPTWFFDVDNDGDEDLLALPFPGFLANSLDEIANDYLGRPTRAGKPKLHLNSGDGTFEDVTKQSGLDHAMLAMGANFGDFDNDGFLDLYVGTGEPNLATLVPNRAYRNVDGRTFRDVSAAAGLGHLQKGHGIAFGDLDNDGDQDVLAVMGGAYRFDVAHDALFLNPGHGHRFVTLLLEGRRANRCAIGARIRVSVETPNGPRDIHVTVGTGGSFGSSSLRQEIGLGDATAIAEVEVRWPVPEAVPQVYRGVGLDGAWRLTEGEREPESLGWPRLNLAGPHD